MPWKKKADNTGLEVNAAGDPIWINEDLTERAVPSISALNNEAKGFRERAEAAELALAPFKGIDPEKAKTALATVKDIDLGKLIDTGKLDAAKAEVAAQFQQTIAAKEAELATLRNDRKSDKIQMGFVASEFVKSKIAVPVDMFESAFKSHFDMDEKGNVFAKDKNGNPIYSEKGNGLATVDEALTKLVDQHPDKNKILRATNNSGTGNDGRGGNFSGDVRTMRRSEFDALPLSQQAAIGADMGKGKVSIVD